MTPRLRAEEVGVLMALDIIIINSASSSDLGKIPIDQS